MTLFNIGVGLASILLSFSGEYNKAAGLIIVSVVVDSFDGYVARKLGTTSKLGSYLDTISDFLSFGVAASVLMSMVYDLNPLVTVIYVVASAKRLHHFMKTKTPGFFFGVPTTVSGGFLATIVLVRPEISTPEELTIVMSWVVFSLSLLMLTRQKYYRIEFRKRRTITLLMGSFLSIFALNSDFAIRILLFLMLSYIAFGWFKIREPK